MIHDEIANVPTLRELFTRYKDVPRIDTRSDYSWTGTVGYYEWAQDTIILAPSVIRKLIRGAVHANSTLLHEVIHSTGHESRCGRFIGLDAETVLGHNEHVLEEMTAEFGVEMLSNMLKVPRAMYSGMPYLRITGFYDRRLEHQALHQAKDAVQYIMDGGS
jgi:antirestriction protein ArdC